MDTQSLCTFLDVDYGPEGDAMLRKVLEEGTDPNQRSPDGETLLHIAARRYRTAACSLLLDFGSDIDARNSGGKTAWAHCKRRGFDDLAEILKTRGADTFLTGPDKLAVAMTHHRFDEAERLLARNREWAKTGNPEEDRLLADIAGRLASRPVTMLIGAGASLSAPGLDGGSPLHQAAWFGSAENVQILIEAGAPLDVFDPTHYASPIHWAAHGSRYSGGAADRPGVYQTIVTLLLEAGSALHYPGEANGSDYLQRIHDDASDSVRSVLPTV